MAAPPHLLRTHSVTAAAKEIPDLREHGYVYEAHLGEGAQCQELGCKLFRCGRRKRRAEQR